MEKKYDFVPEVYVEKLLSYIDFQGNDSKKCWLWKAASDQNGKPKYTYEERLDGKRKVYTIFVQHFMLERHENRALESRYVDTACSNLNCCNPNHLRERTLGERLKNYIVSPEGCWEWQGDFRPNGYGRLTINGKSVSSHRASYEYHVGKVPAGLLTLHLCDNKKCMRPEHLYVGTFIDNGADFSDTGQFRGEGNPNVILKEDEVKEIKALIKSRQITYHKIAEKFGVSRQAIKDIALGRTWSWLK